MHEKDANTSNEVVKQQNKESCLHNTDANTSDEVVKNKDSYTPDIILPSSPKMKYSQQPAQGFAETYKLPFPQTQFFVPFQVFNLFQNNEEDLSSPKLRKTNHPNDTHQENDIRLNQDADQDDVISNQDVNMASLNHSAENQGHLASSSQSSNYDSAEENDTPESNPTPQPVKRYPSRKRQLPRTFQYEDIVNKKQFKK